MGGTDSSNLLVSLGSKDGFLINYNFIVDGGRFIKMLRSVHGVFRVKLATDDLRPAEAFL